MGRVDSPLCGLRKEKNPDRFFLVMFLNVGLLIGRDCFWYALIFFCVGDVAFLRPEYSESTRNVL